MSDIAKRLCVQVDRSERWSDDYHQDESLWAIAREAADEIERLEKLQQVYFRCGEALTEWRGRAMKAEPEAECLKVQLEDECESHRETLAERDHWKALWQGTVEYSTKIIQERDEVLRKLEQEQESHQETAEIMRRTRERAERLQAEIDAMKKQASVSCCTLSYEEGASQCLSCQRKLR